jgi:hypothetical protein
VSRLFHLAGIIPCTSQRRNLKFPWDDYLHPIGFNFLAVERAILECAYLGCETIWVIMDKRAHPILEKRIGHCVLDPKTYNLRYAKFPDLYRKEIPIYYVSLDPADLYQRDSQIWSLIYGARLAEKVSRSMSSWLVPNKFYAANPYAIYPFHSLPSLRKSASSRTQRLILTTPDGHDFRNGAYTGFTFDVEDAKQFYKIFRSKEIRQYDPATYRGTQDRSKKKKLPLEERYSGRRMSFEDVFEEFNPADNCEEIIEHEVEYYYDLNDWKSYHLYLKETDGLKVPRYLFKNREFTRIGQEESEEPI